MPDSLVRAIEQHLANAKEPFDDTHDKPFAVFDFDNTCIVNDVGDAIFSYLSGHQLLRDRELLGEADMSPAYHERVYHANYALLEAGKTKAAYMLNARLFSGFTPGEAEAITLAALTEEGTRLGSKMLYGHHIERGIVPRREILAIMDYLRNKGVVIWIISATPEPAIRAAMKHFGIVGNVVGSRSVMHDGIYASELIEPLSMFEGKVECIRAYVDPTRAPLLVAGDSMSDLPMLEIADVKIAIEGRDLAETARERGWFLLS